MQTTGSQHTSVCAHVTHYCSTFPRVKSWGEKQYSVLWFVVVPSSHVSNILNAKHLLNPINSCRMFHIQKWVATAPLSLCWTKQIGNSSWNSNLCLIGSSNSILYSSVDCWQTFWREKSGLEKKKVSQRSEHICWIHQVLAFRPTVSSLGYKSQCGVCRKHTMWRCKDQEGS